MKPIALTSGDPSGVGLELSLKAWHHLQGRVPFFLIADERHIAPLAADLDIPFSLIDDPTKAADASGLPVMNHGFAHPVAAGKAEPRNAEDVITVIEKAVALVQSGQAGAVCTNPIHKKVLQDGAGFTYPGHTEFLAHLGDVERSFMMLAAPEVKVVPTTIHIALTDVTGALTKELLSETIRATHDALIQDFGIDSPRIAVAGLNPHAGEGGSMGSEEITLITPLLEDLRAEGLQISGPLSADTMFHPAARETYDAAVCMYHDQALIPIKTLNFSKGVNVTLGLPFIRTSPDHGTAFDIAGKLIADPDSLIEALILAAEMSETRRLNQHG